MTNEAFQHQINRLINRFGDKAFGEEFLALVYRECAVMTDYAFTRAVDVWIGHRPHTKPPLLAEFREARLAFEKEQLATTCARASLTMVKANQPALKDVLKKEFGAVDSVSDALKIAKLRRRVSEGEGA